VGQQIFGWEKDQPEARCLGLAPGILGSQEAGEKGQEGRTGLRRVSGFRGEKNTSGKVPTSGEQIGPTKICFMGEIQMLWDKLLLYLNVGGKSNAVGKCCQS